VTSRGGTGGITYAWQLELSGPGDSGSVTGSVGSKSWADPSNPGLGSFGLNGGWTHTSNWIYLNLAQAAEVTITLEANAGVDNGQGGFYAGDLFPAWSLWSGVDTTAPTATTTSRARCRTGSTRPASRSSITPTRARARPR
jgi:hypothetical protein